VLRCADLPDGGGPVDEAAGPWPHVVRWWDHRAGRRCAWWQLLVGGVGCLVSVEAGRASVAAIYD
jgi:hypothetical protein